MPFAMLLERPAPVTTATESCIRRLSRRYRAGPNSSRIARARDSTPGFPQVTGDAPLVLEELGTRMPRHPRSPAYCFVTRSIEPTRMTRSAWSRGGSVLALPYRFCRRT